MMQKLIIACLLLVGLAAADMSARPRHIDIKDCNKKQLFTVQGSNFCPSYKGAGIYTNSQYFKVYTYDKTSITYQYQGGYAPEKYGVAENDCFRAYSEYDYDYDYLMNVTVTYDCPKPSNQIPQYNFNLATCVNYDQSNRRYGPINLMGKNYEEVSFDYDYVRLETYGRETDDEQSFLYLERIDASMYGNKGVFTVNMYGGADKQGDVIAQIHFNYDCPLIDVTDRPQINVTLDSCAVVKSQENSEGVKLVHVPIKFRENWDENIVTSKYFYLQYSYEQEEYKYYLYFRGFPAKYAGKSGVYHVPVWSCDGDCNGDDDWYHQANVNVKFSCEQGYCG